MAPRHFSCVKISVSMYLYFLIMFIVITILVSVTLILIHRRQMYFDIDYYIKGFNKTDFVLRNCSNYENCKAMYSKDVRLPTKIELNILESHALLVDSKLNNFQLLKNIKWNFLVFSEIENGFPHTHYNTILIPSNMIKRNSPTLASTLLHEKVHVFQRLYPNATHKLVLEHYNFKLIDVRDNYINLRRNPDINDIIYSSNDVPILSTYEDNATSLSHIKDYRDHPYEIMAYTIQDMYIPTKNKSRYYEFFTTTREWINSLSLQF